LLFPIKNALFSESKSFLVRCQELLVRYLGDEQMRCLSAGGISS
jgi:hypothetical protein